MISQPTTPANTPRAEEGANLLQHNAPTKPRRVKMGYLYPPSSASNPSSASSPVPYLRLRGNWLKNAGFTIGGNLKIEVNAGRLTIEPAD